MSKTLNYTKLIAIAALFVSMGIVLKVLSITTPTFRFSFFDALIIFAGLILGPIWGLLIGFSVDTLEFFLFPKGFPFSFIILISTMLTGFIPGLVVQINKALTKKNRISNWQLLLTIIITTFVAYSINTIQMYVWQKWGLLADLPARTIVMLVKWPLYFFIIKELYHRLSPQITQIQALKQLK